MTTITNTSSNPATSIKDPRLAAVAQILEKKKMGESATSLSGKGSMSASVTGEKLTVEKLKVKAVMQQVGGSGAPMKM